MALTSLGLFDRISGIALLGIIGFSADKIAEYSIEKIAKDVVRERLKTQSNSQTKKRHKQVLHFQSNEIGNIGG